VAQVLSAREQQAHFSYASGLASERVRNLGPAQQAPPTSNEARQLQPGDMGLDVTMQPRNLAFSFPGRRSTGRAFTLQNCAAHFGLPSGRLAAHSCAHFPQLLLWKAHLAGVAASLIGVDSQSRNDFHHFSPVSVSHTAAAVSVPSGPLQPIRANALHLDVG